MIENTLRRIKAGENDQLEELSTGSNGFVHEDNKGKRNDDEKHFETLSGVPINSHERQLQNKNYIFFISQDQKRSSKEMEEMLHNRMHKKLTKRIA